MSDLKPCPFCGNADVKPYRSWSDNHYVECPQCGTFGPDCESRQEAIDTWNARTEVQSAISAAVQAEREELIAMCRRLRKEADKGRLITLGGIIGLIEDRMSGGKPIFNVMDDSRPAPAVDVLPSSSGTECVSGANTLRATSHAVTRDIAQADGAVDSPKVDVLAVVREYVEAHAGLDNEFEIRSEESIAAETRFESAYNALCALATPTRKEND